MTRLVALAGVLVISFSAIFFRLAAVSPTTAAFFRTAYALPVLFILWWGFRRRAPFRHPLALLSGLLLTIDLVLWHRAIELIGAGLATVLANTQVVFVGLAAWLLHRERPTRLAMVLVPAVFLGVALISGLGRPDAYGSDPVGGVLFGVGAGASYAAYLLMLRASNRGLAPPAGPLFDATLGAALGSLAAGLLIDPRFDLRPGWPAQGWLVLLALSVQVLGWLLITRGLPRLPALDSSILLVVQPMATTLWAFLIFHESLSVLQWTGVGLVLGGVAALSARGTVEIPREVPVSG